MDYWEIIGRISYWENIRGIAYCATIQFFGINIVYDTGYQLIICCVLVDYIMEELNIRHL